MINYPSGKIALCDKFVITRCVSQKFFPKFLFLVFFSPYNKSFISLKMAGYDFILFFLHGYQVMDLDSVDKYARKELDQYPAILTSRLVNNLYTYALSYLCKSLLSYKTDHVQAADQTEARSFVKTATYSWKPELVQKESSGWGGTSATCPRHLHEKPSVPVLRQEHMYKHYKDIRVLKSNVQRATRIELYILNQ